MKEGSRIEEHTNGYIFFTKMACKCVSAAFMPFHGNEGEALAKVEGLIVEGELTICGRHRGSTASTKPIRQEEIPS